ncbi:MAG: hypothetical protein KIS74_03095 [Burkholderiales bacterium]|nr:hypothetical protein [Burkholderiales bacterium]
MRVENLPAGWDAQILDATDSVLATAAESGGTATLDCLTLVFPNPRKIRVRDDLGATIDTFVISGGVWGGDVYEFFNVPPVPDTPSVTPVSAFALDIVWDTILEADEYEVQRSLDGSTGWTPIYTGSINTTQDVNLLPLTIYYYRVRACNEFGCSLWSPVGTGTTLAPPTPPGKKRAYRLRVRNASTEAHPNGTEDALIVTSLQRDPAAVFVVAGVAYVLSGGVPVVVGTSGELNSYIAEPPDGDGQEIDLLTGGVRTGAYSVRVVDAVESVGSDGVVRYVTSRLEDAGFRQQLLSRRAYIEVSENDGATWEPIHAGYVTRIELASAISFVFSIGDTRRVETQRRAFTWSPQKGPTGVSERDVFPSRGCLLGGPITGGFGPVLDTGGDEFRIPESPELDPLSGRWLVPLTVIAAYLPPDFRRVRAQQSPGQGGGNFSPSSISAWYNKVLQPYQRSFTGVLGISGTVLNNILSFSQGSYPDLSVVLTDGTTTWRGTLRAAALLQGYTALCAELDADTPSPPTASSSITYRGRVFKTEVGPDCPIYADKHPVDLVTDLFDTIGMLWDAASAAAVKDALGADLRYAIRITAPVENLLEFLTKSVFGPFGFSIRNGDDGEQEFYPTRLLNAAAPVITISTDSLTDADAPIFTLDESQIVSGFKVSYKEFAKSTLGPNASPPPPPDGIVESKTDVIIQNGDLSVFSTREVQYEFAGFVHLAGGWASAMGSIIGAITTLGLDRYGRGAPSMEVSVLATDEAYGAKLGDEVYLNVAHYPNRNYRIGESTVGARIAQVVRRTLRPYGADLKLVDSGLALQPVTPPAAITIDDSAAAPRTIAEFTLTNAVTINATGVLFVAVEWAIAASEPTGNGSVFARYTPGNVPSGAVPLPPVAPGSRVWVRARTEQSGRRPSAWSAWTDTTLAAFNPPSGVAISAITAESFRVAWTPADASYWTEVFIAPGSLAPSDWRPFRVARFAPGSNQATLRGLLPSTQYIVGVAHVDPGTGEYTTFGTDTDTTTTNSGTAPTPIAITVIQTEQDAGQPVGIGLAIYPFDESYDLEIQRAPDASGVPGAFVTIAEVGGTTQVYRDLLPSDGLVRWYRARHTLPGFTPSPWTGAQAGVPASCPEDLSRPVLRPIVNAYAEDLGGGDYDIFWNGVGTVEVRIDGGSWGAPAPSPINVTASPGGNTYEFRSTLGDQTTPIVLVELAPNPGPVPVLSSALATEVVAIDCGVPWEVEASWLCSPNNDAEYKVVLRNFDTSAQVGPDFDTLNNSYQENTGIVGDPLFTGFPHTRRYTIQLVRLSDSAVVQSIDTNRLDIETGPAC